MFQALLAQLKAFIVWFFGRRVEGPTVLSAAAKVRLDDDAWQLDLAEDLNTLGNQYFWRSFPKGSGKRAKRASMRKAIKFYQRAYAIARKVKSSTACDMNDYRFKILANLANAHRSMCDYDQLMDTIRKLEDIVLYHVNEDSVLDEYELRIMALEANALVSMYQSGYDVSRLQRAQRTFKSMLDAEAFGRMSVGFRSTYWHFVGLCHLLEGNPGAAQKALARSLELRKQVEPTSDEYHEVQERAIKWSEKLLKKATLRLGKMQEPLPSPSSVVNPTQIDEEDLAELKD
jgi:tetratricopeptide (TPR) repeat protein